MFPLLFVCSGMCICEMCVRDMKNSIVMGCGASFVKKNVAVRCLFRFLMCELVSGGFLYRLNLF